MSTIPLTYALLKAAAAQCPSATPPGLSVDTVSGTDHLYSDGDTIGAIARIETAGPTVYVWSNGRVWNRDGVYPAAVIAWIAACSTTVPDAKETP